MKHSSVSLWPQNQEEEPQHGLINNRRVVSDVDILEFRKERQQKQKKKKLPLSRDFEEETERHDVTFFLSFSCHDSLKDSVVLVLHSLLSTLVLLTHHLRRRLKSRRLSDNMCVTYLCYPLLTAYTLHQKVSVDEQPSFLFLCLLSQDILPFMTRTLSCHDPLLSLGSSFYADCILEKQSASLQIFASPFTSFIPCSHKILFPFNFSLFFMHYTLRRQFIFELSGYQVESWLQRPSDPRSERKRECSWWWWLTLDKKSKECH